MKSVEAIKILHSCDLEGRILFRSRELGTLFGESGDTLRSTIKRARRRRDPRACRP